MSELEFRAWVYYGEKLKKPHYSREYGSLSRFFEDHSENDDNQCIEQFTGLKDKNGKEIYEGDIVRWKHIYHSLLCGTGESKEYTERVYWEEKDASFVVGDWFEPLGHLVEEDDVEVIGNIHEKPELLGGEE